MTINQETIKQIARRCGLTGAEPWLADFVPLVLEEAAAVPPVSAAEQLAIDMQDFARHYETMRAALHSITAPADAGCGCSFPCRCDTPEAEAINAESMRDEAFAALRATPEFHDLARQSPAPEPAAPASLEWQPVTRAGQVKKGDKLRFKIGERAFNERAKLILEAGTDKEEVVYDIRQNFYFITSMAINGRSNHKGVEVLAAAPMAQEVTQQAAKAETDSALAAISTLRKALIEAAIKPQWAESIAKHALEMTEEFAGAYINRAPTTSTVSACTDAARDVLAERRRQIEAEDWTPAHDDEYEHGELSLAAACYATAGDPPHGRSPNEWPWEESWWKPADDRRNLVKAGALVLAEIERIDRAAHAATKSED